MAFRPIYGTAARDDLALQAGRATGEADALRYANNLMQQQYQNQLQQQQFQFAQEKYRGNKKRIDRQFDYNQQKDIVNRDIEQQRYNDQQQQQQHAAIMAANEIAQKQSETNRRLAVNAADLTERQRQFNITDKRFKALERERLAEKKSAALIKAQAKRDIAQQKIGSRENIAQQKIGSREKIAQQKIGSREKLAKIKNDYLTTKYIKTFGLKKSKFDEKIRQFNVTHKLKKRKQFASEQEYKQALKFRKEQFKKTFGLKESELKFKKAKLEKEYRSKRADIVLRNKLRQENYKLKSRLKESPKAAIDRLKLIDKMRKIVINGITDDPEVSLGVARAFLKQRGYDVPATLEQVPKMSSLEIIRRAANLIPGIGLTTELPGIISDYRAGNNAGLRTRLQNLYSTRAQREAIARNTLRRQINAQQGF